MKLTSGKTYIFSTSFDGGLCLSYSRYRLMPTFGKDTIRRFSANSSEMKKMAAHDFEDLLQVIITIIPFLRFLLILCGQCAIPVFEGLLPEPHNKVVLDLLFLMAHWHGLAKLRLHTDYTLAHLGTVTTELGEQLRIFKRKTCSAYKTGELPRETAARKRRKNRKSQSKNAATSKVKPTPSKPGLESTTSKLESMPIPEPIPKPKHKVKEFNLNTYKTHSLGDYVDMIRRYGTTDLYSTEVVNLALLLAF